MSSSAARAAARLITPETFQQVLPHFEHQLGLGAEPVTGSLSNESLPSFGNVVPLRRASSRAPSDASTRHLTVVAKAAFTEKQ
jgi:hypothetical protein